MLTIQTGGRAVAIMAKIESTEIGSWFKCGYLHVIFVFFFSSFISSIHSSLDLHFLLYLYQYPNLCRSYNLAGQAVTIITDQSLHQAVVSFHVRTQRNSWSWHSDEFSWVYLNVHSCSSWDRYDNKPEVLIGSKEELRLVYGLILHVLSLWMCSV